MKKIIVLGTCVLAGCVSTEAPKDAHVIERVKEKHRVISYDHYSDSLYNEKDSVVIAVNEKNGTTEPAGITFAWEEIGNFARQEKTGKIRFHRKKGLLMPQLKELAAHLPKVYTGKGWWQWEASPRYEWPNDVTLEAESVKDLMLSMVKSYKLTMQVKGNGVVHVKD